METSSSWAAGTGTVSAITAPSTTPRPRDSNPSPGCCAGRERFSAALLDNGQVLACGGVISHHKKFCVTSSCEIYDPPTNKWKRTPDMQFPHRNHTCIPLNGFIYVGSVVKKELITERYVPGNGDWEIVREITAPRQQQKRARDCVFLNFHPKKSDHFGVILQKISQKLFSRPWKCGFHTFLFYFLNICNCAC